MQKEFLRGKVALILDEQRLVINIGMERGVSVGDRFVIFEDGQEIDDPNSQQSLGRLELVKAQVEAVHVQEKMSLVMPTKTATSTQTTVLSATLAKTASTGTTDIHRDRLNVQVDQIAGLPQINSAIAVGDSVRSIAAVESSMAGVVR